MTEAAEVDITQELMDEASVTEFLLRNPDYFRRHPALIADLDSSLTSEAESPSVLIRQVDVLQERNRVLKRRIEELVDVGRANDELFARTRELTLALMRVASTDELNTLFITHLATDFHADLLCCHIAGKRLNFSHLIGDGGIPACAEYLEGSRPLLRSFSAKDLARIFPRDHHAADGSAVLLPLPARPGSCLAIGSRDGGRYHNGVDTMFIAYVRDLVNLTIERLLQ